MPAPNFPPNPWSQLAASWWRLCLSSAVRDWEMCFLPHRGLSSIITRGGLENDSSRQLLLTVWGLKANTTLPGKQGWWWPLLPKVHTLKNVFPIQFGGGLSGNRADSIIKFSHFSWLSIEKMQFTKFLLRLLTEKDRLSCFTLFSNKVCVILDSIGCTLFPVRAPIAVNEKIPNQQELYADGWQHFTTDHGIPLEKLRKPADTIKLQVHFNTKSAN